MSKEELKAVFEALQSCSFISQQSKLENWLYIFRKADKAPAKFEKVIWCDTDSKTKQIIKLSLFDLLALLGVKEQSATKETMNKCFAVPTGCRFTANNYSWIDWQKIESQHHKQLVNIVEKAQKEALANKDNKIK